MQTILSEFTLMRSRKIAGREGYELVIMGNAPGGGGVNFLEITTAFPTNVLALAIEGNTDAREFIAADIRRTAKGAK